MSSLTSSNNNILLTPGTIGRKISLKSNYFPVLTKEFQIYHYDIEIDKPAPTKSGKQNQLEKFINTYKTSLFKEFKFVVHDGNKNLFCSQPIQGLECDAKLRKEFEFNDNKKPKDNNKKEETDKKSDSKQGPPPVVAKIKYTQTISTKTLKTLKETARKSIKELNSEENADVQKSLMAITGLDIILSFGFKNNDAFVNIGRNFFKTQQKAAVDLGMGKEIWFGFHQSLRPCQRGIMLNVDVAATTFIREQSFIEHIMGIMNRSPPSNNNNQSRNNDKNNRNNDNSSFSRKIAIPRKFDKIKLKEVEKECRLLKLQNRAGERKYRFAKFTEKTASSHKFKDHNDKMISVQEYFETVHKYKVQYPDLQMAQMEPTSKEIYIPVEFLTVLPGQHYKKKLTGSMTATMVRACAKKPNARLKEVEDYVKNNKYNSIEALKGNAKISDKMVEFEGRVLPPPEIEYKNQDFVQPDKGVWQMRGKKEFYKPVEIKKWFIIGAETEKNMKREEYVKVGEKLSKFASGFGMKMEQPKVTVLKQTNKDLRIKELEKIFEALVKQKADLAMLILNQNDGYLYNKMKSLGDVQNGIHTQCLLSKNAKANKLNQNLAGNVLLKINAKLNGINNQVKNKTEAGIMVEPTLILGADVTHPSPGENTKPSIAALVGSMNRSASRYQCEIAVQTHRQEMIGTLENPQLKIMTSAILEGFYKETFQKPRHIIYYRDGVSEGQFEEIIKTELHQINEACQNMPEGKEYAPSITVVICQKRHHTRLFAKNDKDCDRSGNVLAGTCVDSDIVAPRTFNFYLCSHAGIQGTSRPVHYNVIYIDHPELTGEKLQELTYKLCHLYQRCNRSVSLPAPVYFAHLAAFRAGVHLKADEDFNTTCGSSNEYDYKTVVSKVKIHEEYKKKAQYYL